MVIKMKKTSKILGILIISLFMISICSSVFALNTNTYRPDDPTINEAREMTEKAGIIIGIVRNISAVVAVIVIMVIGVKYMFGSVEDKANYKATMMPYIIGCVMAVAGTTLVSFIYYAIH